MFYVESASLPIANGFFPTLEMRNALVLWPAEWEVAEIQEEMVK